jgi:hypothetical protein
VESGKYKIGEKKNNKYVLFLSQRSFPLNGTLSCRMYADWCLCRGSKLKTNQDKTKESKKEMLEQNIGWLFANFWINIMTFWARSSVRTTCNWFFYSIMMLFWWYFVTSKFFTVFPKNMKISQTMNTSHWWVYSEGTKSNYQHVVFF